MVAELRNNRCPPSLSHPRRCAARRASTATRQCRQQRPHAHRDATASPAARRARAAPASCCHARSACASGSRRTRWPSVLSRAIDMSTRWSSVPTGTAPSPAAAAAPTAAGDTAAATAGAGPSPAAAVVTAAVATAAAPAAAGWGKGAAASAGMSCSEHGAQRPSGRTQTGRQYGGSLGWGTATGTS
jgi:hypothetical protein